MTLRHEALALLRRLCAGTAAQDDGMITILVQSGGLDVLRNVLSVRFITIHAMPCHAMP